MKLGECVLLEDSPSPARTGELAVLPQNEGERKRKYCPRQRFSYKAVERLNEDKGMQSGAQPP